MPGACETFKLTYINSLFVCLNTLILATTYWNHGKWDNFTVKVPYILGKPVIYRYLLARISTRLETP